MDLNFDMDLAKAEEQDGRYFIEGVASTTERDKQNDIVSSNAIVEMAKSAIGLPITRSHNEEFLDDIGSIIEATATDNNTKLFIRAELDKDDPEAMRAFKKLQKGKVAGFSIGGNIRSVRPGSGATKRVIDSVSLSHIMLTSRPVAQNTFCAAINKALDKYEETTKMTLEEMLANEEVKSHIASEVAKAVELAKSEVTEEIAKAGAKFSADTIGVLNDIAASGDDSIKAKIAQLLGTEVPGAPEEQEEAGSQSVGVEKSEPLDIAALTKSITDAIKIELASSAQELGRGNPLASDVKKPMFDNPHSLGDALRNLFGQ